MTMQSSCSVVSIIFGCRPLTFSTVRTDLLTYFTTHSVRGNGSKMAVQQVQSEFLVFSPDASEYETEENAASEDHYGTPEIARTSRLATKLRLVWNYYTKRRNMLDERRVYLN